MEHPGQVLIFAIPNLPSRPRKAPARVHPLPHAPGDRKEFPVRIKWGLLVWTSGTDYDVQWGAG